MEHQVTDLKGADISAIKTLYKFLQKAFTNSNSFIEKFVDSKQFLNQFILSPLIDIARNLRCPSSDNQVDLLK